MLPAVSLPVTSFEDSRRLTGFNLYFDAVGAVLETVGAIPDDAVLHAWQTRVRQMRSELGWPDAALVVRRHASGAALAFAAPVDQLFTATEVNEWAWLASLEPARREPFHAPGHAAAWDVESALHTLRAHAASERDPVLAALLQTATDRGLTTLLDDDELTLGTGRGGRGWPLAALPAVADVAWDSLHAVPLALVTGSNGKTTTVRLLAALLRAHGWHTGYSCTDGLFLGDEALAAGDYSGPAGARAVLRQRALDAAVLETARGGILRRGLAVSRANVAVVTNISVDHFGEYGIHDLDGLAEVKLVVAHTLGADGTLVLNADDALLLRQAQKFACPIAWFALDDAQPRLQQHRRDGGMTCGVRDGRLRLHREGVDHDLGAVAAMPLTFAATAVYNIANIAAAVLAASALGVRGDTIAAVLATFGAAHRDNPGRLQHWRLGATSVFLDYAHNVDGLRGLLAVATRERGDARLLLVLGQAGNREDREIRELAELAARFAPARIVLKDIPGMLRGRAAGEVPQILRGQLQRCGVPATAISECLDEAAAARQALAAARDGDVLVLPIHSRAGREEVVAWLDRLHAAGWHPGLAAPPG